MPFQTRHFSVVALGLSLMILGISWSQAGSVPPSESARTQGTVAGFTYVRGGCEPWAEFTIAGRPHTTNVAKLAETPCPYTIGQSIGVAYDPADPAQSSVLTGTAVAVPAYVALVLGAAVLGVGLWRYIRLRPMPAPSGWDMGAPAQTVTAQKIVPDGPVGAHGFQRFRDFVTLPLTIPGSTSDHTGHSPLTGMPFRLSTTADGDILTSTEIGNNGSLEVKARVVPGFGRILMSFRYKEGSTSIVATPPDQPIDFPATIQQDYAWTWVEPCQITLGKDSTTGTLRARYIVLGLKTFTTRDGEKTAIAVESQFRCVRDDEKGPPLLNRRLIALYDPETARVVGVMLPEPEPMYDQLLGLTDTRNQPDAAALPVISSEAQAPPAG